MWLVGVLTDNSMTVYCEGDRSIVEQLGEKQDFESELTRQGFKHEDFTLHVLRETPRGPKAAWSQDYSVTVTNCVSARSHVYQGGPKRNWVTQSSLDLAKGAYGPPPQSRPSMGQSRNAT